MSRQKAQDNLAKGPSAAVTMSVYAWHELLAELEWAGTVAAPPARHDINRVHRLYKEIATQLQGAPVSFH